MIVATLVTSYHFFRSADQSKTPGGIGMSRIKVETNPVGFFKENTPVARHFNDIHQDMSGSFPLSVVVASEEDAHFEGPEHLKRIDRIQRFLDSLPGVDKTISFVDVPKDEEFQRFEPILTLEIKKDKIKPYKGIGKLYMMNRPPIDTIVSTDGSIYGG